MTANAAQIRFAAEFVTFLVAAAGLALVVLRNELTTNRPLERLVLTMGFLWTAVAAFCHGSLLLRGDLEGIVIGLRIGGIVGLGVGSTWWRGGEIARRLLWLGLFVTSIAVGLALIGAGRATDIGLTAGSLVIGSALLVASRRSVAARVAASAAGTLLLVVLVLSVALSAVLSSSIQREELNRLRSRANTEANLATHSFDNEIPNANIGGLFLDAIANQAQGKVSPDTLQAGLLRLQGVYPGGWMFLLPAAGGSSGGKIIANAGVDNVTATVLAGLPLVASPICGAGAGAAQVVGTQVLAVAEYPLCQQNNPLGVVVRDRPLDFSYLTERHKDDPSLSLAVVDQTHVLAKIGPQPSFPSLKLAAASVLNSKPVTRVAGSQYLAAEPIQTIQSTGNQVVAALVVSAPTSAVVSTRDRLFRTLFLIALGGTLLALGLAVLIGDRITAGLRRLTLAAESIQRGERGKRSGISSDDEVGVLGAAFDSMADSIEQQTHALQAAADDETRLRNRLQAVVAGMGDALVAVDGQGMITDFNQAAEELTGITAARAVGRPVDEVVVLVNEDGGSLGVRLRTPSPARWGTLATAFPAAGAEFPVAVSAGALRGPGSELAGQVLVVRDLRREREVERMKTEFLSRVGHELRTPLTGIIGYADILLRRPVPAERAQLWHEEILVSAKRLLRIVEMLEFFASSGAGRVLLRPEPIDVRQLVDVAVATWAERLTPADSITSQVSGGLPAINGDRRWLALAVDELIDNAVKFSREGVEVNVAADVLPAGSGSDHSNGSSGQPAALLEISVTDHGKGMTADEQAIAFGEFVQGDSSDTRQFGGLGLGLSLVQRVVESHGGSVRCISSPGGGSTFSILLPLPPEGEPLVADIERRHSNRMMN